MKYIFYIIILDLHVMTVGFAREMSDDFPDTLIKCARAAALVGSIDFGFVVLGLLSPVLQLYYQIFNFGIMHRAIHKLHFHLNMAASGCLFGFLHICFHVIVWISKPGITYHDKLIYSPQNTAFATGLLMVLGFVGAFVSGYFTTRKESPQSAFSSHLPFAALGFAAFFGHGHQRILGSAIREEVTVVIFIGCASVYAIFFFFNPVHSFEVDKAKSYWAKGVRKEQFMLLVVKYNDSHLLPPGSFFNIYNNDDSFLAYFHGHPFSVFSTKNKQLAFLVHCRASSRERHSSFTERLYQGKYRTYSCYFCLFSLLLCCFVFGFFFLIPNRDMERMYLKLQGPFKGPANSFVHYLASVQTASTVYLCGWNSGFASVFSLLEHLKVLFNFYSISYLFVILISFSGYSSLWHHLNFLYLQSKQ
jgi:hypothetical protein